MVEPMIIKEIKKCLSVFNDRYIEDGNLKKFKLIEDLNNYNNDLISILLSNEIIKDNYIVNIDGIFIFQVNQFVEMLQYRDYWSSSYTKYKNKIGLTSGGEFLVDNESVVLDFPYKDSLLKAGMTKDDDKKDEEFLNEIISKSEIDILLEPKIVTNIKEYSSTGISTNPLFSEEKNYIIKGNNLIALHSIKTKYEGKIDVIYIDPPYNVKNNNNTFLYNNRFNHSTWLIFMKNRLEISKKLLTANGALLVAIDENELSYLGVLLDEIFPEYDKHLITIVHNPRGVQGTNFSYNNEFVFFIIPKNKKIVIDRILNDEEIEWSPLRNWGGESLRTDAKNCFYPIVVRDGNVIGFGDVCGDEYHPNKNERINGDTYIYPIDKNGIERKWRYARQTVESIRDMLKVKVDVSGNMDILLGKNFGQYKTVWQDKRYDASIHGKQLLKKYVPETKFTFPKSVYAVYDCLYAIVGGKKDAKILDFFGGSGTTAHAVELLNANDDGHRNYIIIEQMDYVNDTIVERMKNVSLENNKEQYFIYYEFMEKNQGFVKEITSATKINELMAVYNRMIEVADLDFQVDLAEIDWTLPFEDQKRLLIQILDKNQLYFNYSEIDDEDVREFISDNNYNFNKNFYEGK